MNMGFCCPKGHSDTVFDEFEEVKSEDGEYIDTIIVCYCCECTEQFRVMCHYNRPFSYKELGFVEKEMIEE